MSPRPGARLAQQLLPQLPKALRPVRQPLTRGHCRHLSTSQSRPRQQHGFSSQTQQPSRRFAFIATAGFASFAVGSYFSPKIAFDAPAAAATPNVQSTINVATGANSWVDTRDASLPRFHLSEVRKHDAKAEQPWVIHGDKVYDITNWISAHPGGEVILRAAGGSIDPYWDIFSIHKNQYVYDILSQYLIGYVHPADLKDGRPPQDEIEDPFADDPQRDPALITRTAKPRNAETPNDAINSQFLTPNELFYVRNHMWVPRIAEDEADNHRLSIELLDGSSREYSLKDLKTKFPKREITAVLQCSGNRRKHMTDDSGRKTNGLQWSAGAISNASWEGVLLADVLADAGFENEKALLGTSDVKHVEFKGMEAYGASIPIKKAVDPQGDVLLAYAMNGKTLPRDHGYPLRAIVPGHVAARSVKWLNQITLGEEESQSQWQRKDYKCFGPNQTQVDWDKAPAIQELPVQSAITTLTLGNWVKASEAKPKYAPATQPAPESPDEPARKLTLSGYAFSGGGRSIIRVDVSVDEGKNWMQAYLLPDCDAKDGSPSPCHGHGAWTWKRWRFHGAIPATVFQNGDPEKSEAIEQGDTEKVTASAAAAEEPERRCTTLVVKATDEVYNTQPETHASTWNIRGNLANAWHRVQVCSECKPSSTKGSS